MPDFAGIVGDASICGGHPTIAATHARVADVPGMLGMLTGGVDNAEILAIFSDLTFADTRACLGFAAIDHVIVLAAQ